MRRRARRTPAVNEWVDFRSAGHASAIGKCLLSQLDVNARRDHLARHKIARLTSRTITNERVLLSQLDTQPPTVPVLDLQEYAVGTVCAAVPSRRAPPWAASPSPSRSSTRTGCARPRTR